MSAMDFAKTKTAAEVIQMAADANLLEFGADRTPVAEKWNLVNEERDLQDTPIRVVAALNNADMNYALLGLIKGNEEKLFAGMAIAAKAVDAAEQYIYIPEEEADYAKELEAKASQYDIKVFTGIVNVRESRGSAFHHFETLLALNDLAEGNYEPATYMAVCKDGKTGDLVKVAYGTKVADLVGDVDAKAIAIGTKLYDTTALEKTIDVDTQIGNGVITIYGSKCCMMHELAGVLLAERKHSCGKCTFCREGLIQLHTMADEITKGQGKKNFTEMIDEIGSAMVFSTPCTMGQTASDFAMGCLEYFSSEFEDHIKKKKCKNNVCSAFMSIYIDPNTCTGCEECADVCPADAIEGKAGFIHMIDEFECTKCGKCIEACDEDAIIQTDGRVPKLPTRLVKVGKFKKR